MSRYVSRVYWTLLLISIISSCVLFIIVASEGARSDRAIPVAEQDTRLEYNVTLEDRGAVPSEELAPLERHEDLGPPEKAENVDGPNADAARGSFDSFEANVGVEKAENLAGVELYGDLTQQPNLSQGVPETDQAVVLTLVDTAAAELHNLAEPRLNLDKRSRKSLANNLSLSLGTVGRGAKSTTEIPMKVDIPIETITDTASLKSLENLTRDEIIDDATGTGKPYDRLEVVVVRADQSGSSFDTRVKLDDEESTFSRKNIIDDAPLAEIDEAVVDVESVETEVLETESVPVVDTTESQEDIPSFSEWAQKRLEEAEKKKTHPNASVQNFGGSGGRGTGSTKVRSKNYASPDCGAKIVAANPEAGSASSVLSSSRDEYMLNTCTSRIWFVVELCEALQAEKIELANFELFSSSPKNFTVFVGDRWPSRDWSPVGQFAAKDERDIQSFVLDPRLFGKFIKVEFQSHYGSEHFCPVSLFRVYGTSEFEVLETENQLQESDDLDDDEELEVESETLDGEPPRNLFGSARDAVLSIVKKAARALVKSGQLLNSTEAVADSKNGSEYSLEKDCRTPNFLVERDEESDGVKELIGCRLSYLERLLGARFVRRTISDPNFCNGYGFSIAKNDTIPRNRSTVSQTGRFLEAILPRHHLLALCNLVVGRHDKPRAIGDSITGTETRDETTSSKNSENPANGSVADQVKPDEESSSTRLLEETHPRETNSVDSTPSSMSSKIDKEFATSEPTVEVVLTVDNVAHLIKPTKTTNGDDLRHEASVPILEPSRETVDEATFVQLPTVATPPTTERPTLADESADDPGVRITTAETRSRSTVVDPQSNVNFEVVDNNNNNNIGEAELSEAASPFPDPENDVVTEKDVKLSPQDQINLDTLLSDLKDLEADSATPQPQNAAAASTTLSQPTTSTPQQKESVFLRLSNRIKTLERNMSLSGQYLEELSRRYKKQVEEMQRSLERAIGAMNEESRRGEERDTKRVEEISDLREQVTVLTRSMKTLLNEKDSWRGKFNLIWQHLLLVSVEIVVVLLVISYCRRSADLEEDSECSTETRITRRRSTEGVGSYPTSRKARRRRPSEIVAARIAGSYRELLIGDDQVGEATSETVRKNRKRKRKHASIGSAGATKDRNPFPGGTDLPSRRASSSDAPQRGKPNKERLDRRPDSAPETTVAWFDDQGRPTEAMKDPARTERGIEELNSLEPPVEREATKNSGILKTRNLPFVKTALKTRKERLWKNKPGNGGLPSMEGNDWEWYSKHSGSKSSQETLGLAEPGNGEVFATSTVNGFAKDEEESRSETSTPTTMSRPKDKKTSGIKKIVKRFF